MVYILWVMSSEKLSHLFSLGAAVLQRLYPSGVAKLALVNPQRANGLLIDLPPFHINL